MPLYHVTSTHNRASIEAHGLDVRLMGAAPGIAGSTRPEQDGCFLATDEWTADYFVAMNNTGGPVDVWEVEIDEVELAESGEGYLYFPGTVDRTRLRLARQDLPPSPDETGTG